MSLQKQFKRQKQNLISLRKLKDKIIMKEQIKASRQRIDALLEVLKNYQSSREYYKAYDSLQLGFMRLGLVLGELGTENPYPESMKVDSKIIHEQSDKAPSVLEVPKGDEIATVKFFRVLIDNEIKNLIEACIGYTGATDGHFLHVFENAISCITDSKMWFGAVLNSIRQSEINYQKFLIDNADNMKAEVKEAYARYGAVTDFKNFQDNPMPTFDELPELIQKAWHEAVQPRDGRRITSVGRGNSVHDNRCL